MALKKKLAKEAYEKLSDAIKGEYKLVGDEYVLDVDGEEDIGALRRAKEREAKARKDAEDRLEALEKERDEAITAAAKKGGDISALEKSWQTKLDKQKTEDGAKLSRLEGSLRNLLVDNVAKDLAHSISTSPNLILPHIKSRLSADFDGDTPVTRVLGKDGKPSALTLDELKTEFVDNKEFKAIIKGSQASGGRMPTDPNRGGAPRNGVSFRTNADGSPVNLAKVSPSELVANIKANSAARETA